MELAVGYCKHLSRPQYLHQQVVAARGCVHLQGQQQQRPGRQWEKHQHSRYATLRNGAEGHYLSDRQVDCSPGVRAEHFYSPSKDKVTSNLCVGQLLTWGEVSFKESTNHGRAYAAQHGFTWCRHVEHDHVASKALTYPLSTARRCAGNGRKYRVQHAAPR